MKPLEYEYKYTNSVRYQLNFLGGGSRIGEHCVPTGFHSLDYYPLLPWAGLFLFGVALGKLRLGIQKAHPGDQPVWARPFTAAGRRSLEIYLLHQPVLIGLLWMWNYFKG